MDGVQFHQIAEKSVQGYNDSMLDTGGDNSNVGWISCRGDDEKFWGQFTHRNRIVPSYFKPHLIENIVHAPLRDDDVLICSYPKTGTHWFWENIRMLVHGEVKTDTIQKEMMMMEIFDHAYFNAMPSPRIFTNHAFFDDQPSDLLKGKTKVVLLCRNPKDTCVSFYYHTIKIPAFRYNGKFSNFMQRFVQGKLSGSCCFDYMNSWEEGLKKHPNIKYILMNYEDLLKNPISERRRLASFLGRDYDDAFLQEVAEATSIDKMRQVKSEASFKDDDGQAIMYRKGKVGDWKDHFTVSQSEWFDRVVEKEMGGSELFKFVYSID